MEYNLIISFCFLLLLFLLLSHFISHLIFQRQTQLLRNNLPPGPSRLPILGNLLHLGRKPHKSLAEIAKIHGPLISLQLGWCTTIVVSSPSVAQEMSQENDAVFANRTVGHTTTVLGHHLESVVFLPPGPRWRYLRRVCTSSIFTSTRLNATRQLRIKKIGELLNHMKNCCDTKTAVNISQTMFITSFNILSNTVFSVDLASLTSSGSSTGCALKELVWGLLEVGGEANISDFFPVFKSIDPQGCYRRSKALLPKMIKMFEKMIEERLRLRISEEKEGGHVAEKDVLDVLLRINQEEEGRNEPIDIPHLLLDLFVAGTDTTSSTVEWAMTELLRNSEKMENLQEELDEVIGHRPNNNPINETDIAKLPYLNAVIKETLRLHPAAPFLIPRKVDTDTQLCGYYIPKDAQVLVNVWAIGRDESVWKDASSFVPERFLGSSVDIKGHHYELLPFGLGRRVCVGMPMALKILSMTLGSLIHSFDWRLEGGGAEINMDDKFGITLQKSEPLCVIPCHR